MTKPAEAVAISRKRRSLPSPPVRAFLREQGRLTQADVAAVIGVDRAAVSRYESGGRTPRGVVLDRYIDLLNRIRQDLA